jgi:hypothetical protein
VEQEAKKKRPPQLSSCMFRKKSGISWQFDGAQWSIDGVVANTPAVGAPVFAEVQAAVAAPATPQAEVVRAQIREAIQRLRNP